MQLDLSVMGLMMVVPWSLPEELQSDVSEPRAKMGKIFKDKVGDRSLFTSVITDSQIADPVFILIVYTPAWFGWHSPEICVIGGATTFS